MNYITNCIDGYFLYRFSITKSRDSIIDQLQVPSSDEIFDSFAVKVLTSIIHVDHVSECDCTPELSTCT